MSEQPESGPIGTRILFEDEHVRIWDMTLEAGEDSGRHHHENPYAIVIVEGDRVGLHEHLKADGSPGEYREASVEQGAVVSLPAGGVETAVNAGSRRYRDIQVEFLTPPSA
jgi:quercetin dioxygenase-like cupin family protein